MGFETTEQGKTSTVNIIPPSAEEIQLLQKELALADQRFTSIRQQLGLQTQVLKDLGFNPATGEFSGDANLGLSDQQIADAERLLSGQQDFQTQALTGAGDVLQSELGAIAGGSRIDPETAGYIDTVFGSQFESGASDIDRALRTTLESIREELAPSLGLRPEDTPIQDRGARMGEEAVRQLGQLLRDLQGGAAAAKLNFPLQQGELTSTRAGQIFNVSDAADKFVNDLQQQAFLNRQLLLETGGQFNVNTATATGASPGTTGANLQAGRFSVSPQTVNLSSTGTSLDLEGGLNLAEGLYDFLKKI